VGEGKGLLPILVEERRFLCVGDRKSCENVYRGKFRRGTDLRKSHWHGEAITAEEVGCR